jgi:hypothetical protein
MDLNLKQTLDHSPSSVMDAFVAVTGGVIIAQHHC